MCMKIAGKTLPCVFNHRQKYALPYMTDHHVYVTVMENAIKLCSTEYCGFFDFLLTKNRVGANYHPESKQRTRQQVINRIRDK